MSELSNNSEVASLDLSLKKKQSMKPKGDNINGNDFNLQIII